MKADDVPVVGRSYDDPAVPAGPAARVDVCLVTMPYAAVTRPSLALGLLASALRDGGISASVAYANLWFMERVGIHPYHLCSHQFPTVMLAGEWTFAASAFPGADLNDEHYLEIVRRAAPRVQTQGGPRDPRELVATLRSLRAEATAFVDDAARRVLVTGARVVGCTSTFEQHVASLALLRRVRELDPAVVTVMGGANCEAAMGRATHRLFPWVDYVVSGEADGLIVPLCRALLARGRDVAPADMSDGVFGPRHRGRGGLAVANGAAASDRGVFRDLDVLPLPDFADYFATLMASTTGAAIRPGLPLETSRGCWWGVAHHCTFCGLNGKGMAFRSKSPDRVLAEVRDLEARHGLSGFESVDNILDAGYYRSFSRGWPTTGRAAVLLRDQVERDPRPRRGAETSGDRLGPAGHREPSFRGPSAHRQGRAGLAKHPAPAVGARARGSPVVEPAPRVPRGARRVVYRDGRPDASAGAPAAAGRGDPPAVRPVQRLLRAGRRDGAEAPPDPGHAVCLPAARGGPRGALLLLRRRGRVGRPAPPGGAARRVQGPAGRGRLRRGRRRWREAFARGIPPCSPSTTATACSR